VRADLRRPCSNSEGCCICSQGQKKKLKRVRRSKGGESDSDDGDEEYLPSPPKSGKGKGRATEGSTRRSPGSGKGAHLPAVRCLGGCCMEHGMT
jgi:hypothetical protein